jgi:hypothetical protein
VPDSGHCRTLRGHIVLSLRELLLVHDRIQLCEQVVRLHGNNRTPTSRRPSSNARGSAHYLKAHLKGAWIKLREKELEARGPNMDDESHKVIVTLNDYAQVHEEEKARADQLAEEVEALKGQIAAMGGKERPRPPRPTMN